MMRFARFLRCVHQESRWIQILPLPRWFIAFCGEHLAGERGSTDF